MCDYGLEKPAFLQDILFNVCFENIWSCILAVEFCLREKNHDVHFSAVRTKRIHHEEVQASSKGHMSFKIKKYIFLLMNTFLAAKQAPALLIVHLIYTNACTVQQDSCIKKNLLNV